MPPDPNVNPNPSTPEAPPDPPGQEVGPRRRRYLIGNHPDLMAQGATPLDMARVKAALDVDPEAEVHRTLAPRGVVNALSGDGVSPHHVVVASMPEERADQLNQHPQLIVEEDHPLFLGQAAPAPTRDPRVALPYAETLELGFLVRGEDGAPIVAAEVLVFGSLIPGQGVTDADGRVTISMRGETPRTIKNVYINPKSAYWNAYLTDPELQVDADNVVTLLPLTTTFPDLPGEQLYGWGEVAMGLDALPASYTGAGAKVCVIDSGAAALTHADLEGIVESGIDLTNADDTTSWTVDTVQHGTFCAGIVAGKNDSRGILGFAPGAEVHVCKIFPGGAFSDLIDALDYCINAQIDVASLSLGSPQPSQLLRQRLQLAKEAGVACVVAAGNSGGAVQYPAAYPEVLAVAAIGRLGEFPPGTYHASQVLDANTPAAPYFAAKFSCFGPQVDVCAPGVAILSSVPPNDFAVWDGTSMATPHVSGLATLVVAHHPDFQGPFRARDAQRVERLFQIITETATPIDLGDRQRTGAGLPNVGAAIAAGSGNRPAQDGPLGVLELILADAGLLPGRVGGVPSGLAALEAMLQGSGLRVGG